MHGSRVPWLFPALALVSISCSREAPRPAPAPAAPARAGHAAGDLVPALSALPEGLEIPALESTPIADLAELARAELRDEALAAALFDLGEALRRRELTRLERALAPGFAARALDGLAVLGEETLVTGATRRTLDAAAAPVVDAAGFGASLGRLVGGWRRVETAEIGLERADYAAGEAPASARAELRLTLAGVDGEGTRVAFEGRARAELVRDGERWRLARLAPETFTELRRERALFVDVSHGALPDAGLPDAREAGERAFGSAACADVDGDHLFDVFVPGAERARLYRFLPSGVFVEEAEARGLAGAAGGTGAVFFDFDSDSDEDLAVGRPDGLQLFINDGEGRFVERGAELGFASPHPAASLCVLDFDRDGWLDVFVCGYGSAAHGPMDSWLEARDGAPNALLRNELGLRFKDVAKEAQVAGSSWSLGCTSADPDIDGDADLFVANDWGTSAYYKNQGDGTFVEAAGPAGLSRQGYAFGATFGDLDGDGWLDLYLASAASVAGRRVLARGPADAPPAVLRLLGQFAAGSAILPSSRGPNFHPLPAASGGVGSGWALSPVLADFDLDGRLDVFCTQGFRTHPGALDLEGRAWSALVPSVLGVEPEASPAALRRSPAGSFAGRQRDLLALNRGGARFDDLSLVSGADSSADGRAALAADFDDDGDLDLFVVEAEGARVRLLSNTLAEGTNGWIKLQLVATKGAWQALGAIVTVEGTFGATAQTLARGSGFGSCQPSELVFGTGSDQAVRVSVRWSSGYLETFGVVLRGKRVVLVESAGVPEPWQGSTKHFPEPPPAGLALALGAELPALELVDAEGRAVRVDPRTLVGETELWIALFSADSTPASDDVALLERTYRAGATKVVALCVDAPSERERAEAILHERGASYPRFYRGDSEASRTSLARLVDLERLCVPTTLIVSRDARLLRVVERSLAAVQAEKSTSSPASGGSAR